MRKTHVFLLCVTQIVASGQTVTTLVNFTGPNGTNPAYVALIQGTDGCLYGTTSEGGVYGNGTAFKVTLDGVLTTLHSFHSQDGVHPYSGVIQARDGDFYGTTWEGGSDRRGTVFRMTPDGAIKTLHSFLGTDGSFPASALVQATNGNFYGTTGAGGDGDYGTVFEISPAGKLSTLLTFDRHDGSDPVGSLVQATGGYLFGTTAKGGGQGSIFKITMQGEFSTIYHFTGFNGAFPDAGLVQDGNGTFYGTTTQGGASTYPGLGTIFKVTQDGKLTILHSFDGTDGQYPYGLALGSDGNLYGTNAPTVFKITPDGSLTTLASASGSYGAPVQATDGNFYWTTVGAIYKLSVGLPPFVRTSPSSGKAGTAVVILGTELTGTTSVTFNGTPAEYTILSPTEITTSVPAGATSGAVQVLTPAGALLSNPPFQVRN